MDLDVDYTNGFCGINLNDYVPIERSCNTIVYYHKSCIKKKNEEIERDNSVVVEKEKEKKKTKKKKVKKDNGNNKVDVGIQCELKEDRICCNHGSVSSDPVLEHTIKFAKDIAPLTIPPSREDSLVYYTIKTSQKSSKKTKKPKEDYYDTRREDRGKESHTIIETFRKETLSQKESFSVKETYSHSNTLDELQLNPSLSCTYSEISDKKTKSRKTKRNEAQKFIASESFDALATEILNSSGEAKIKIHLMNDSDKNLLSEAIRAPLIKSIKECISEINNKEGNTELTTVKKLISCNSAKLDKVIERINQVEKKLEEHAKINKIENDILDVEPKKPSTLELLGADLAEAKNEETATSEEELYEENLCDAKPLKPKGISSKAAVIELLNDDFEESDKPESKILAGGEDHRKKAVNSLGSRPDRPNRIPARFCWTDAKKQIS